MEGDIWGSEYVGKSAQVIIDNIKKETKHYKKLEELRKSEQD